MNSYAQQQPAQPQRGLVTELHDINEMLGNRVDQLTAIRDRMAGVPQQGLTGKTVSSVPTMLELPRLIKNQVESIYQLSAEIEAKLFG